MENQREVTMVWNFGVYRGKAIVMYGPLQLERGLGGLGVSSTKVISWPYGHDTGTYSGFHIRLCCSGTNRVRLVAMVLQSGLC